MFLVSHSIVSVFNLLSEPLCCSVWKHLHLKVTKLSLQSHPFPEVTVVPLKKRLYSYNPIRLIGG